MAPEIAEANQAAVAQDSTAATAVVAQVLTDLGVSPTSTPTRPLPAAESWEVALAQSAGSRLTESIPHKTAKELADELLRQLGKERRSRELQNLNHWPDYAPGYLNTLVRSLANKEAWRRRQIDAFYLNNYEKACAIATAQLPSREEAEDAAGEAFARLVAKKTSIRYFYRTLNQVIVDRLRELDVERGMFVSVQSLSSNTESNDGDPGAGLPQIASRCPGAGDPMRLLMDRRNRVAKPLMVAQAKKNQKWRYVRRGKWTDELKKSCAKTTPHPHK